MADLPDSSVLCKINIMRQLSFCAFPFDLDSAMGGVRIRVVIGSCDRRLFSASGGGD